MPKYAPQTRQGQLGGGVVAQAHRTYEVRCPVYGFVKFDDWEREIISCKPFQRLRRIRQLAWTDLVYPGAMHTRFEHSLGVMNMATLLYDGIVERSGDLLQSEMGYDEDGLRRHRVLVRLAALLHDVGHGPFSHAAEELLPELPDGSGRRYGHEHYTAEIIRRHFRDAIENHPKNTNYDFTADDVADFIEGKSEAGKALFWRELVAGQLDADRMDYLLRDSLHAGVDYGKYDWRRLVNSVVAVTFEDKGPRLGVDEGGWHSAEGLILARYFMFTQVYFHKTRSVFDHHLHGALAEMLPGRVFPGPERNALNKYLQWDDWKVMGLLAAGKGGEHGSRLSHRDHFREVRHTPETPSPSDLVNLELWKDKLGDLLAAEVSAEKSWYKVGSSDVPVVAALPPHGVKPLSDYSSVVGNIKSIKQVRLYVRHEDREEAESRLTQK
ncbi:MAG TPA: HD domain-containing protein [Nitrospiraceae bacterium]